MACRRALAWSLAIPLMVVGSQVAHALAFRIVYPQAHTWRKARRCVVVRTTSCARGSASRSGRWCSPAGTSRWAVVFAGWHIPTAYDYALAHRTAHDLEHASFLLAGLRVWMQLVDPFPRRSLTVRRRLSVAIGLFALGTILADALILSPGPLYGAYVSQPERGAVADHGPAGP